MPQRDRSPQYPDRLSPDQAAETDDQAGPRNPLFEQIEAAISQFSRPTRRPGQTESRRDGCKPNAREHVRRYFLRAVFGMTAKDIAAREGIDPSTVSRSIAAGKQLVHQGADERGFFDPVSQTTRYSAAPTPDPLLDRWSLAYLHFNSE